LHLENDKPVTNQDVGPPSTLDHIVDLIVSNLRCESVYLFGSRARGDSTEGSDLDLIAVVRTTGILRSVLGVRNLRRSLEGLSVSPDIHILSTLACSRNKESVVLNVWHSKCGEKLLYGKDSLASELGVLGFVASHDSFMKTTCYEMKWFLKYIKLEGHVLSVDRRGLTKLMRFLRFDSEVSAETTPPQVSLMRELERQVDLEVSDPQAVCRALANYIEAVSDEFDAWFPRRISQTVSILIDKGRLLPRTLLDRDSPCFRITKSLTCLLRSVETDPPNGELVHQAATYLGYLLHGGVQNPIEDPKLLWMRIRDTIREYWDTVMRAPFGSLCIHRAYDIVLL
jgi:predicted nucleotidyltransferase